MIKKVIYHFLHKCACSTCTYVNASIMSYNYMYFFTAKTIGMFTYYGVIESNLKTRILSASK